MRSGHENTVPGYSVQTAVDADCGLIVLHEVTDRSADSRDLQPMSEGAKEALAANNLPVVADTRLMEVRMAAVEHPFAVLKQIMGLRRFLCRGLGGAKAVIGLGILSYNLARMVKEAGVPRLLAAMR